MINREDIKKICDATLEVKKCIDSDDYFCDFLNSLEQNLVREYYKFDDDGPVVNLRKEICKEILLGDLTSIRLSEIINARKSEDPSKFRSWSTNFSILNSLVVSKFNYLNSIIQSIIEEIQPILPNCKYTYWDFKGGRNQGQKNLSLAFYNNSHRTHSLGKQLFIDFEDGLIKYGIYKHSGGYLTGPFIINCEEFNKVLVFFEENKQIIFDDVCKETEKEEYTFTTAAIKVLKNNSNNPMSAREIWDEIEKKNLYTTTGKTPAASLSTIMLSSSSNSNIKQKSKKIFFECVGENPIKFKLINFLSNRVKDTLIDEGFVTLDKLKEILEKNNIKITI
jgi:hypothetical protein